jgi:hypothetical protein
MAGFFVEANKRFNLASSSRDLCPKLFHSKFLEKIPKDLSAQLPAPPMAGFRA